MSQEHMQLALEALWLQLKLHCLGHKLFDLAQQTMLLEQKQKLQMLLQSA
jgi:hypothetical protein